ncbi:MAG: hypothetical protein MUF21_09345, partial [Gemmatimonadaceae bacterium]|nr:hypothetical protein [Gemmatimonadaceae bacterium]
LGTLAGGVAHDLNNVFAAITGYAQLMRLQAPGGSASADDLAAIEGAADRGATLVRSSCARSSRRRCRSRPISPPTPPTCSPTPPSCTKWW